MSLPKDFAEMMLETVVLSSQSAIDKYGKPSWGTGTSYQCRIINDQRILKDQDGRDIIESGRAIIYGVVANASVKMRITLPNGSQPAVTSVSKIQDEDGDHHSVIGFGS